MMNKLCMLQRRVANSPGDTEDLGSAELVCNPENMSMESISVCEVEEGVVAAEDGTEATLSTDFVLRTMPANNGVGGEELEAAKACAGVEAGGEGDDAPGISGGWYGGGEGGFFLPNSLPKKPPPPSPDIFYW